MSSLKGLELSCERDEANLTARMISLQLATNDGAKLTSGIYEVDDDLERGGLAFEEYKNDIDVQSLIALHQNHGEELLFKGQAYIMGKAVGVLAFRKRRW
jgi:hypothetical protein